MMGQSCTLTKSVTKGQPMSKTIIINECQSENAVKKGDTLILRDIKVGDTLSITFSVNAGTGLGWDLEPSNLCDSIAPVVKKTVNEISLGENRGKRIYTYIIIIKEQQVCFLNFWLQRRPGSTRYKHCCIKIFSE